MGVKELQSEGSGRGAHVTKRWTAQQSQRVDGASFSAAQRMMIVSFHRTPQARASWVYWESAATTTSTPFDDSGRANQTHTLSQWLSAKSDCKPLVRR